MYCKEALTPSLLLRSSTVCVGYWWWQLPLVANGFFETSRCIWNIDTSIVKSGQFRYLLFFLKGTVRISISLHHLNPCFPEWTMLLRQPGSFGQFSNEFLLKVPVPIDCLQGIGVGLLFHSFSLYLRRAHLERESLCGDLELRCSTEFRLYGW